MPVFETSKKISASVKQVADFHQTSHALKRLTPPPIYVQIHSAEPLSEGSETDFTLWFGPLPVRWLAKHSQVNPQSGFIDTQVKGPMRTWQHVHSWEKIDDHQTLLKDKIQYEHHSGWRGLITRLLFAPPLLQIMFFYRHFVTSRFSR